ncbi:MAG: hypothetical protein H0T46_09190 [Deltaproteobacteria bacterium]|nr:hypothetical protein [Deltaproteobacteria bacterium]
MRILAFALVMLAAACGADSAGSDDTCQVSLTYMPDPVVAGIDTEVRVISVVTNSFGNNVYNWSVMKSGMLVPFEDALSTGSEIVFIADEVGTYDVTLDVRPSSGFLCPQGRASVNALMDLNTMKARLHITPPANVGAPLVDRPLSIRNATDFDMGPVVLEPGVIATGQVRSGSTVIPAYLQFSPLGMPGAVIETFTSMTGQFSVRLLDQPHEVIVVPMIAGYGPRRVAYSPSSTTITLALPQTFSGVVRQGAARIAGAKVQLTIDGVPSTLTTTDASGNFSVLGFSTSTSTVKVEVTPAGGSGLPRLEATGTLDLASVIDVNYSALTLRNLSGTSVRRGANAQANKKVAIVGTIASAGTITAGSSANATGFLRINTTTDAAGTLPSVLAPAGPLFAVTTIAPGDLAVGALDLTAGVPAQIDAPGMTSFATDGRSGNGPLDGATLDLVPAGALALAGAPTLHFTADLAGRVIGLIPSGGSFDVRWSDPASRRAPLVDRDVTQLMATYVLPPAVYISGDITVTGSSNPVIGASVQVLCADCTGIDKNRPIAEAASDPHGSFSIAVPDPGAM